MALVAILEAEMKQLLLGLAAIAGATVLSGGSARAYEGPWCASVQVDDDTMYERCDFQTFEACRKTIIGGDRGFCGQNPRYNWSSQDGRSNRRVRR
jgi:hypothetical protein